MVEPVSPQAGFLCQFPSRQLGRLPVCSVGQRALGELPGAVADRVAVLLDQVEPVASTGIMSAKSGFSM